MMQWKEDNSNLDKVALEAILRKNKIAALCCSNPEIHVHAYIHRGVRGSLWVWCSHCGAFSHLDGVSIPPTWKNNKEIDLSKICAVPDYLNKHQKTVDDHLKQYFQLA